MNRFMEIAVGLLLLIGAVPMGTEVDCAASRGLLVNRWVGGTADEVVNTYRPQPEAGHQAMTLGIGQFRDPRELRLDRMLTQPFRDDPGECREGERPADSCTNAS